MRDVSFHFSNRYDSGLAPCVGVAGGTVVEVHRSEQATTLWYHVGDLFGGRVDFGSSHQYDDGIYPAVAVNAAGTVVEVHETQAIFSSGLYYHVGQVNREDRTLTFGPSHEYDSGNKPKVALNDSHVVVEVHESDGPSRNMWYHVGTVDPVARSIAFGGSHEYDSGITPWIAINNDNVVVEVHQADGYSTQLWYRVGVVDPASKTIAFGASHGYDNGAHPSVALTDDGFVLEVHQSEVLRRLWRRIGRVDVVNRTIDWIGGSLRYGEGIEPAVASDGNVAVEVHLDGTALHAVASLFIDRTSWMADDLGLLGDKTLREIALPASHDAGMGIVQDCRRGSACNSQTHDSTLFDQLQKGSRYFDIRPVSYGGTLYAGHYEVNDYLGTVGCNGQSLADLLGDVNRYLADGRDLLILKFSHYFDRDQGGGFSPAQMETLLQEVTQALGPSLFRGPVPPGGLESITVGDYLGSDGRVLAVFDGLDPRWKLQFDGVYSYADKGGAGDLVVFDEYSNTNDLDAMAADQMNKLLDPENHGDNLFLLSWTLSQSKLQATTCEVSPITPSVLDLAREANAALWAAVVNACQRGVIDSTRRINLLYTDDMQGTQTDCAIWVNRQILR